MRERLKAFAEAAAVLARAHLFWVEIGGAAIVVIVVAVLVGRGALRRAAVLEVEAAKLERVLRGAERWLTGYEPPSPEETARWRRSERALRGLSVGAREQAALIHELSQRAEALGVERIRSTLASPDSVSGFEARAVDAFRVEQGPAALGVAFEADYPTVHGYIGSLPSRVEVRRIRLEREGRAVRAYFLITTFRVAGGEDANGAATQADAGDRGVRHRAHASGALGRTVDGGARVAVEAVAGSGRAGGVGAVPDGGGRAGAADG